MNVSRFVGTNSALNAEDLKTRMHLEPVPVGRSALHPRHPGYRAFKSLQDPLIGHALEGSQCASKFSQIQKKLLLPYDVPQCCRCRVNELKAPDYSAC